MANIKNLNLKLKVTIMFGIYKKSNKDYMVPPLIGKDKYLIEILQRYSLAFLHTKFLNLFLSLKELKIKLKKWAYLLKIIVKLKKSKYK